MKRYVLGLLLCLGGALAAPGPARGTSVLPMSLGQLVDRAQLVFTGEAVHREVVLSRDGSFPFTFVTFRLQEVLKGRPLEGEITLRLDGGETDRETVSIDGMPEFTVGETYLLFVQGNGSVACPVLGWRQGQLRFAGDPQTGATLLVDSRGVPVRGIDGGEWVRDLPAATDPGSPRADEAATVLLEEDGVEIGAWPEAGVRARRAEAPRAESAVAALRSYIAGRSRLKSFALPQPVESARPFEVPARMSGRVSAPPHP